MTYMLPNTIANHFFRLAAARSVALALLLGLLNLFLPLAATAGPVNDNFSYAAVASGSSVTLTGSNVGATKESGEPNHAGNAGGKSVWWSWTAPSAGTATITTFGSSFDTMLGVYTGTTVSGLTTIASNDDSGSLQSRVAFTAVAGTTYRIAVDGYNGASGNVTLSISESTSTTCTYAISTTSASVGSTSTSGSVSVTTTSGCTWSASSGAAWITITSGTSGNGNGTVYYSVAANTSTASRTGTLTIAGKTFTVTQAAAPTIGCTYSISTTSASVAATASSGSVSVTTTSGCGWTASSSATSWLTCSPASGTGSGTVGYSVIANTSTSSRVGTLTIAGQTFTVSQAAGASSCTYSISGSTASFGSAGGPGSVGVTAGTGCTWTAASGVSWVTISSGGSGTGSGTVSYSVAANTGSSRSGTLTIAGQSFTVSQAAATADTAPTASLISPSNGATISSTVTFSGTATDDVGVTKLEFWCDGSVLLGTATTSPYSIAYNTTTMANGSHSFTCKAYDGVGHVTASTAVTATVSNSATATGQLGWVKTMLCNLGSAFATGVAADRSGNVIISGSFNGTVDLGAGPISSVGGSAMVDGFVAKYSAQGSLLWVKQLGSSGHDYVQAVALDSQDNIVVAGRFQGTVDFGGGPLTSAGGSDIYVAKYSPTGAHLWSKRFGGAGSDIVDVGNNVAVDGSGNVIVAAEFEATADFGGVSATSAGRTDVALVKLSATSGATLWAKRFGGPDTDIPRAVAVDRSGDVVVTGYFYTSIDLGGGSLPTAGSIDIFLAKYSGVDGAYRWGKRLGGSGGDMGAGIATDPNTGNIVVTGLFKGTVDFGGGLLDTYNNGGIFMVGYGPSGNYLWALATGSGNTGDLGLSLNINASGNLALAGKSTSGIYFGGTQMLLGNGQADFFVASFTLSGNLPPVYRWAKVVGAGTDGASQGNGVALNPAGQIVTAGSFLGTTDFGGRTATAPGGYGAGFVAQYGQ